MSQEKIREANQIQFGNIQSKDYSQGYGQPVYTYPMKYEKELLTSKAKSNVYFY